MAEPNYVMGTKRILENPHARVVLPNIVKEACAFASLATVFLGWPVALIAFAGLTTYIAWRIEYKPKPDESKVIIHHEMETLQSGKCLGKVDLPIWAPEVHIWTSGAILSFFDSFTKESAIKMSSVLQTQFKNLVFDGSSWPQFHLYEDSNGKRKIVSSTKLPCFSCVRNDTGAFCTSLKPVWAYAIFSENGYIDIPSSMATVAELSS